MLRKAKYLSIPSGFEYYNIQKTKKLISYKKKIQDILENKGMIEFLPPLLDYIEVFSLTSNSFTNGNSYFTEKLFEVKDSNGELLAIRSDLTVMAMKSFLYHANEIDKIQYYYIQPVYRDFSKGTGLYREIYQAGVEWIGNFENRIINLFYLARELLEIFPYKTTFVFGNALVIKKLLQLFPDNLHKDILNGLYYKDIFRLKEICKEYNISQELKTILTEIPLLIGDYQIHQEFKILLKNYPAIYQIIKDTIFHLKDFPFLLYDFSLIKEFSYYTGIIFEAYINQSNSKALTGGIYDNFSLQLSHKEIPSCGFALNLSEFININEV
ncbi:MAG: hypothetical protein KatS3mg129_0528 [Leptospiraceae bacterium]|nr:MAG: hypothetical protein KatS3mg129_0528 [Leptospiraceae bacterium]